MIKNAKEIEMVEGRERSFRELKRWKAENERVAKSRQ